MVVGRPIITNETLATPRRVARWRFVRDRTRRSPARSDSSRARGPLPQMREQYMYWNSICKVEDWILVRPCCAESQGLSRSRLRLEIFIVGGTVIHK